MNNICIIFLGAWPWKYISIFNGYHYHLYGIAFSSEIINAWNCSGMELSFLSLHFRDRKCCHLKVALFHYDEVTMSFMASQITSLTIVYSTVYSGANQRKHQSSASLAFVRGIHRGPVNFPHKGPVMLKMFPFDDVIMPHSCRFNYQLRWCWMLGLSDLPVLLSVLRGDKCIRISHTQLFHIGAVS